MKKDKTPYEILMSYTSEGFEKRLIQHCDKKIESFFAEIKKQIETVVKKEVRRIMKVKK